MWIYEKKLQFPVKIKNPNPKMAQIILSQYGGPDGELGASLRYLSQRFSMPNEICKATLNDIGSEELGHLEMIGTIVYQLTRNLTPEEIKASGFDKYFVDHNTYALLPSLLLNLYALRQSSKSYFSSVTASVIRAFQFDIARSAGFAS